MKRLVLCAIVMSILSVFLFSCDKEDLYQVAHDSDLAIGVYVADNSDVVLHSLYGVINSAKDNNIKVTVLKYDGNEKRFESTVDSWLTNNKNIEKGFISIGNYAIYDIVYDKLKKDGVVMGIIDSNSLCIAPRPQEQYYDYLADNDLLIDFICYYDMFEIVDAEIKYLNERCKNKYGSVLAAINSGYQYSIKDKNSYIKEIYEDSISKIVGKKSELSFYFSPIVWSEKDAKDSIGFYFKPDNDYLAYITKSKLDFPLLQKNENFNGELYYEGVCDLEILSLIENGTICAGFELPYYMMGENSVEAVVKICNNEWCDYYIKGEFNILTKENYTERKEQIENAKVFAKKG